MFMHRFMEIHNSWKSCLFLKTCNTSPSKTTVFWNKPSFQGGKRYIKMYFCVVLSSHALTLCSKYAVAYLTTKRKTNYVNQYWGEYLLFIYLFYFLRVLRWVSTKSSTRSKLNYNHEICIYHKTSHALIYIYIPLIWRKIVHVFEH